jgi:hypothetical protein
MNREKLIEELIFDEGMIDEVYKDHLGYNTFGVGHLILDTDKECGKPVGTKVSKERIIECLNSDIDAICADLDRAIPWWRELDDDRQRVMANMGVNKILWKLHLPLLLQTLIPTLIQIQIPTRTLIPILIPILILQLLHLLELIPIPTPILIPILTIIPVRQLLPIRIVILIPITIHLLLQIRIAIQILIRVPVHQMLRIQIQT